MPTFELHGTLIFVPPPLDTPFHTEADAIDLIRSSIEEGVSFVALPVEQFEPTFFDLRTRSLGEFIQKFVTYKRRLAFIGDMAAQLAASSSLRAFVREANEGDHVWFLADLDALSERLKEPPNDE